MVNIQRAYQDFWKRLQELTNGRAQPGSEMFAASCDDQGRVVIETPTNSAALAILGLTARRDDRERTDYDVYIQVRQVVKGVELDTGTRVWELVSSNVRLLYVEHRPRESLDLERSGSIAPAKVFQGFHFDIAYGATHHPVFHAQSADDVVPDAAVQRRCMRYRPRCDAPRIPTAPMELIGVVYMILHDHFSDKVRKGWPAGLAKMLGRLPRFRTPAFLGALDPDTQMDCTWWYLHAGHA